MRRNGVLLLLICLTLAWATGGAGFAEGGTVTAAPADADPGTRESTMTIPEGEAAEAASMTLNPNTVTLNRGKTVRLEHVLKNARSATYTWESSNPKVATVVYGAVKGTGPGHAVITCTAKLPDGRTLTAMANVTVLVPVQSITLTGNQGALNPGESARLFCTVSPDNASNQAVTWSSSHPEVATVDDTGLVTAVSAGKATITCTAADGSRQKAQKQISVRSIVCGESIVFVTEPEGRSFTLDYYGSNWQSNVAVTAKGSNFSYRTEEKNGKAEVFLTPLAAGKGTLTFSDRYNADTRITVVIRVTSGAIPLNQYILFKDVKTRKDSLTLTVLNHSGADIAGYDLRFIPYNKAGEQLYLPEEAGGESRHYVFSGRFSSGKTRTEKLMFSPYEGVDHLDLALVSVTLADGTRIDLADNALYWYSTGKKKYLEEPETRAVNCLPDRETTEKAESFLLGYVWSEVTPELAEHYGYRRSGLRVTEVEPGSLAEQAGLREKDLIIAADGTALQTDPYAADRAKAKIANGGSMTLTVERPGEAGTREIIITRYR